MPSPRAMFRILPLHVCLGVKQTCSGTKQLGLTEVFNCSATIDRFSVIFIYIFFICLFLLLLLLFGFMFPVFVVVLMYTSAFCASLVLLFSI